MGKRIKIRCSKLDAYLKNLPVDNTEELRNRWLIFSEKVKEKVEDSENIFPESILFTDNLNYRDLELLEDQVSKLLSVRGLKKVGEDVLKQISYKKNFLQDELPDSVKKLIRADFCEQVLGIEEIPKNLKSLDVLALKHGTHSEEDAIELINFIEDKEFSKNEVRHYLEIGHCLLTGEWDLFDKDERDLRDVKCPVTIQSYMSKTEVPENYKAQLMGYKMLVEDLHKVTINKASIDYILMPVKEVDLESVRDGNIQLSIVKNNEIIESLDKKLRQKRFVITFDNSLIESIKRRLFKVGEYFNTIKEEEIWM